MMSGPLHLAATAMTLLPHPMHLLVQVMIHPVHLTAAGATLGEAGQPDNGTGSSLLVVAIGSPEQVPHGHGQQSNSPHQQQQQHAHKVGSPEQVPHSHGRQSNGHHQQQRQHAHKHLPAGVLQEGGNPADRLVLLVVVDMYDRMGPAEEEQAGACVWGGYIECVWSCHLPYYVCNLWADIEAERPILQLDKVCVHGKPCLQRDVFGESCIPGEKCTK